MSFVLNMVGGSGGGKLKETDAVIVATVPTGSTVTATKGGTTLTPTMWVKAADNTLDCAIFSIPASQFDSTTPWTITATLGTNTGTATVTIDSNKQYDIEVLFNIIYAKDGFLRSGFSMSILNNATGSIRTDIIPVTYQSSTASNTRAGFYFSQADLTKFSTLTITYSMVYSTADSWVLFGFTSNDLNWTDGNNTANYTAYLRTVFSRDTRTQSIDITSCAGLQYFKFCYYARSESQIQINDMFLS